MRELILHQTEDGRWEAQYARLPGYRAFGSTPDEAVNKIKDAIMIYSPCRCDGGDDH
ncbi:MAG: type II toxin-antitoxin system HicB family antitoxin [Nitrospirae bacterium]|nr:type II toxin-antitoxin system HicB family antitoxin [Nitrospirota bacterium]